MNDILTQLFGSSSDLNVLQMVLRGVLVFALTLLMYRISGRRSLGQHSLFDVCVTVLLGAILSRAVVGASPLLPTIATGFALVLFHRAIAHVSARSESFSTLVNGRPRTLVQDGSPRPPGHAQGPGIGRGSGAGLAAPRASGTHGNPTNGVGAQRRHQRGTAATALVNQELRVGAL